MDRLGKGFRQRCRVRLPNGDWRRVFAQDTDSAAAARRGQDSGPPFLGWMFFNGVICMPYLRLDAGHWRIGLSSVRFKEGSARFRDKSAEVDDDFAFALGKFALTPFADCLGD